MKYFLFLFLLFSFHIQAQFRCQDVKSHHQAFHSKALTPSINNNAKSDTVDILNYHLELDLYSIASQQLKGRCDVTLTPKMNGVGSLELDLLELQVDSIRLNNSLLNYNYNDTLIRVYLGANYTPSDTLTLSVYYQGSPQGDASGWGGFHFQNGYYFNLGVGFAADPHTYGRAWFPCFDNFVEKSTYSFSVLTKSPNKAYCNGIKLGQTTVGQDSLTTDWLLTDKIPTYLASVAVSNYQELNDLVNANLGSIPIQLMAKAQDTANLKASFQNLKATITGLEDYFGDYQWQRVGYAITTVGAMEHATSIHYPISLVDGTLNGEDIMAHELAHHWWGNLVTCKTAADMWINEGLAEFSSHLYLEKVYNRNRYLTEVRNNGFQVLNNAHKQDNGYRAIYDLPHEYVYGFHVYQKGAMVGHNLRAYLGDNLFFSGVTSLLSNNAFKNLSTTEFRDQLSAITGTPLNDFFDGWVLNPGFPSFSVDSSSFSAQNAYVKIVQHTREAPNFFQNIPVEVTFFSASGDTTSRVLTVNGFSGASSFGNLPFTPVFALAGFSGKLLSGDTYDKLKLDQVKIYNGAYSKMRLQVKSVTDSANVIVMQHWAGAHNKVAPGKDYRISNGRFWSVRSNNIQNADITARINYELGAGRLDEDLFTTTEDSVKILYRANPSDNWELYIDQNKVDLGSSTNGVGYIELNHLKTGDYILANTAEVISLKELSPTKGKIDIYPNPTQGKINLRFNDYSTKECFVKIMDSSGRVIHEKSHTIDDGKLSIQLQSAPLGVIVVDVDGYSQPISLIN